MTSDSLPAVKTEASAPTEYAGFWIRLAAVLIDAALLVFASWGLAIVLYFIGFWVWRGQTLGQIATHIKVVRIDGKSLDLGAATLRFVGLLVCVLTLGIGFLLIVFDERKRGLHDRIAGTHVVVVPKVKSYHNP